MKISTREEEFLRTANSNLNFKNLSKVETLLKLSIELGGPILSKNILSENSHVSTWMQNIQTFFFLI